MQKEEKIEVIAAACHMANRAYCTTLGDFSQKLWDEAADWQRQSARDGVVFALANHEPGAQHDAWCADKVRDGWVYGPVKDADKKTHPSLLPFANLPRSEQVKDEIFLATVQGMRKFVGL